jgi:hypothetical protein
VAMTNGGRIEKAGDDYLAYPSKLDATGKSTSITVSAKFGSEVRSMGFMEFRVKEVPPPVATISGRNGGNLKKEDLLAEDGVFAELKDFDFDLKFKVTQFDVNISGTYVKTYSSKDNKFTSEQKDQFGKLSVGGIIYIDNIMAKGDDGQPARPLAPISFKIK